jgi:hypothetical protein
MVLSNMTTARAARQSCNDVDESNSRAQGQPEDKPTPSAGLILIVFFS